MGERAVVIGAGVVGLSSAYFLSKEGFEVTVLDQNPPGTENCSFGNGGMIVPSHFTPLAAPGMVRMGLKMMLNPKGPFRIKPSLNPELLGWMWKFMRAANQAHVDRSKRLLLDLNFASKKLYEELSSLPEAESWGLTSKGLIALCKDPQVLHHESELAQAGRDLGLDIETLTPEQLEQTDPNITMDVAGGVLFKADAHLAPHKFVEWLRNQMPTSVQILENQEVTGFEVSGGRIHKVLTSKESHAADQVVLAAGAWSGQLGRKLGLKIPMQAGKGYSFMVENPVELPDLCALLIEARIAVTPMMGQLRFGGTMEIAGVDLSINPTRVQGIKENIPRYYPKFKQEHFPAKVWAGLRPCSPDGLPYLGRCHKVSNLILSAGHSMMGLSLGPITGKLVSQIAANRQPEFDLSILSPERYD